MKEKGRTEGRLREKAIEEVYTLAREEEMQILVIYES